MKSIIDYGMESVLISIKMGSSLRCMLNRTV